MQDQRIQLHPATDHAETLKNGAVSLRWSPVNQAWFLMWFDQLLGIFTDKRAGVAEFRRITDTE